ncbi:ASCH domain-containing protein [Pseudomonas sp. Fl4BN1]|uniref:ASCH domain-containing protein n=1 Tax=Pseudomonas sp. Fl4BN1 TaxID=2697651 RepID=UPI001377005E|nr:ASCH domain-containing protein [Pseudomonas sp. Fl4BN1]NBF09766.1 ASCH domain-containing protein [Pseudomonas sp. Fl4BN1]
MKALSIRQPWAWLIIHGGKDVENRSWHTKYRGRFLVHASKGMTRGEYDEALELVQDIGSMELYRRFPSFEALQRGGITGPARCDRASACRSVSTASRQNRSGQGKSRKSAP